MDGNTTTGSINRGGTHGGCALAVVAVGMVAAFLWELPARARDIDKSPELLAQGVWAAVMTVAFGVALASIRRGPQTGRVAAWLALGLSLLCIGWVAVKLSAECLKP